jgi:hypothetical protein
MDYEGHSHIDRVAIDRLRGLVAVLPALAEEAARARRELALVRRENQKLTHRLAQLESRGVVVARSLGPTDR